jgi:hypothetical protein
MVRAIQGKTKAAIDLLCREIMQNRWFYFGRNIKGFFLSFRHSLQNKKSDVASSNTAGLYNNNNNISPGESTWQRDFV